MHLTMILVSQLASFAQAQLMIQLIELHDWGCHRLLCVTGTTPTVVVIEDAHFLDSMSWKLLLQLTKCQAPLLLVATAIAPLQHGE